MGRNFSRKEQRKLNEQIKSYRNLKKNAAALGTAVTACSVVTPLMPIVEVFADEAEVEIIESTNSSVEQTEIETSDSAETSLTEQTETESTEQTTNEQEVIPAETIETEETTQAVTEETAVAEEAVVEEKVAPKIQAKVQTAEVASFAAVTTFSSVNQSAYIEQLAAYAKPIAEANDLYASVMIAQAVIESGWGQSLLSKAPYYNLFGIKGSYNGQTVYMNTQEYLNGQWVTMKEPFRKYPSFQESFEDNARTLKTVQLQAGVYYYSGAWKSNTNSYRDATAWLTGRYATAPTYASSLNNVIETYNLTRFDSPSAGGNINLGTGSSGNVTTPTTPSTSDKNTNNSNATTYTVKSGDYLGLIATNHGITVDQLRSWNNLKSDLIFPGQKLTVKQGSTSSNTNKPATTTPSTPTTSKPANTAAKTYTVKSGDYLGLIAANHGITVDQLRSWNNIKGDLIFPGQKLTVKQGSTSSSTNKPATTPTTSKPANTAAKTYTVKSGDYLGLIAANHGITVDQLRSWNKLKGDLIFPGQKLTVKQGSTSSSTNKPATTTPTTSKPANTAKTYTVKSGDYLGLIAANYGITVDQLRSWNNIKGDIIFPGQKLVVKQGSSTTTTSTTQSKPTTSKTNSKTHQVKSGDSLWDLSMKYGSSISQIKSWNKLSSDIIYVGQNLKVG